MLNRDGKNIAIGITLAVLTVVVYYFVLSLLLGPHVYFLDETLHNIDQKDQARLAIEKTMPLAQQEELLNQRFGKTVDSNEIYAQKRVVKAWKDFCIFAFAILSLGVLASYFYGRKENKTGNLARHITVLFAFAFCLPVLFFNEAALRIIAPLAVTCSIIYAVTLLVTSRIRKKEGASAQNQVKDARK